MRYHDKNGGTITFRHVIGEGEYKGHRFELAVTMTPLGDIHGMPVITWDDGSTVIFEVEDIVPRAFDFWQNEINGVEP